MHSKTAFSKKRTSKFITQKIYLKKHILKLLTKKNAFQNLSFISAFINATKGRTEKNKSLIRHD